ncbi:putative serine/threonine-protein kinase, partial [Tetrabaena socialis]
LAFAASIHLLGPGLEGGGGAGEGALPWLSSRLSRLQGCGSLQDLVGELCGAVAEHVGRRFLVEAGVAAALVPAQDAAVGLMLRPGAGGGGAAGGGGGAGGGAGAGGGRAVAAGSGGVCSGCGPSCSCSSCSAYMTASGHMSNAAGSCGSCGKQGQGRRAEGAGADAMASRLRLQLTPSSSPHGYISRMAGPSLPPALVTAGPLRPLKPLESVARWMAGLTGPSTLGPHPANGAACAAADSSGLDPGWPAAPARSARSVIIPLSAAAGGGPGGGGGGGLHAHAFPMQHTLLAATLAARRQGRSPPAAPDGARAEAAPQAARAAAAAATLAAFAAAGVPGAAAAAASVVPHAQRPGGLPAAAAACPAGPELCVEDVARFMLDVHGRSRDVGQLLRLGLGSVGLAGGARPGAGGPGGGGGGAALGPGAAPRSLVLLTLLLEEEGAALGLYVCFPRHLPGRLLAAVRDSCAELLEGAFAAAVCKQLRGALAPEYDTLRSAVPGSYAVVPTWQPSFCETATQLNLRTPSRRRALLAGGAGGGRFSLDAPGAATAIAAAASEPSTAAAPAAAAASAAPSSAGAGGAPPVSVREAAAAVAPRRLAASAGAGGGAQARARILGLLTNIGTGPDSAARQRQQQQQQRQQRPSNDVKPANLLLKSSPRDHRGFTVKLADFGFVLRLTEVAEDGSRYTLPDQPCGTVTHMAPECLPGRIAIGASADVYAFGILMWELLAGGVRPYLDVSPDHIPRHVYNGARPVFGTTAPSWYREPQAGTGTQNLKP